MAVSHFTDDYLQELCKLQDAYVDLLKLMSADIPEYVFLEMLNERFQQFLKVHHFSGHST